MRAGPSPSAERLHRPLGILRFFLLGFLSLTIQTVLAREALFAFHGGEVSLGLFYAVWLGAIAAGAAVAAHRSNEARPRSLSSGPRVSAATTKAAGSLRAGDRERGEEIFWLGWVLLAWWALIAVGLFRHHRLVLALSSGAYLPAAAYLLLLAVTAGPAGFMTGALFPVGLRSPAPAPGNAYAIEALGSMAGGAFASLYALSRISPVALLAACAIPVALPLALLRLRAPTPREGARVRASWKWHLAWIGALGLALLFLSGVAARLDQCWSHARWSAMKTGTAIVADEATPYHQVTLAEREGEAFLYLDGLYAGALGDPYSDSLAAALVVTQHPSPQRMLLFAPGMIGPARLLAEAQLARGGAPAIRLVRADPMVDRLAQPRLDERAPLAHPSSPAQIVTADPRAFVCSLGDARPAAAAAERFDLIALLHSGPESGSSNRLYTREFFASCAAAMKEEGAFVVRLPGSANVASPETAAMRASIFAALKSVFGDVRATPGTTLLFFAARPLGSSPAATPLSWDPDTLAARWARALPGIRSWPPALFALEFPPERVAALAGEMERQAARVEENRDGRPFVYYQEIRRWDRFSGSRMTALLDAWHRHPWRWTIGVLFLLACVSLILSRGGGAPLVSLATTGMAGMGADLIVLLLYQTLKGTLYLEVGLVIALYMMGLGAGGLLGERWIARRRTASSASGDGGMRRVIFTADVAWVVFLVAWVPFLRLMPACAQTGIAGALLALAFLAGALTALPFAAVAQCVRERALTTAAGAGGRANAADHAGALLGALLTGILFIPLLGFAGALLALACVKLTAATLWLLPGGRGAPAR